MYPGRFSIITPTYNHEKYIAECIESVLNQTYTDWEMLIIDDGSTDHTAGICRAFAQKDGRIKYFHQPNKGIYRLAETYNFALSNATGEFVAILEGDDYWYANKLWQQAAVFENPGVVFSWCGANIVNNKKDVLGNNPQQYNPSLAHQYNNTPPGAILPILISEFPIPATWAMRSSVLAETGGFLQVPAMPTVDLSTILALSEKGAFAFINKNLVAYRRQLQQATRTLTVEIGQGTRQIVSGHIKNKTDGQLRSLLQDRGKILKQLDDKVTIAFAIHGRSCLVKKQFGAARQSYWKALTNPSNLLIYWRLKSLLGFVASFFCIDIEWIARLFGKKTYK